MTVGASSRIANEFALNHTLKPLGSSSDEASRATGTRAAFIPGDSRLPVPRGRAGTAPREFPKSSDRPGRYSPMAALYASRCSSRPSRSVICSQLAAASSSASLTESSPASAFCTATSSAS